MLQKYVGCKVIAAEPCRAWKDAGDHKVGDEGYKVVYPDGYISWSPKETFEAAYVPMPPEAVMSQEDALKLIKSYVAIRMLASIMDQ